jgi:succinate dehydrogenase / fumarate reductase flavoprotein subunit
MVRNLTQAAVGLVKDMDRLGVPFHREQGQIIQRNFGGQKKKRTAYAKSSTGKMLMAALIDAVRRYEAAGLVERYPHHRFERLIVKNGKVITAPATFPFFTGSSASS